LGAGPAKIIYTTDKSVYSFKRPAGSEESFKKKAERPEAYIP